jgi:tungsten cofactor oxidoreducase radical SAM maturase
MPKATLGEDGRLELPRELLERRGYARDLECWVNTRDGAIILLPRLPDLTKLYVEPTTSCNLECRTCIRNTWDTRTTQMEMDVFRSLMEQTKELPALKRIVLSGLGEPFTHRDVLEMARLIRERDLAVTIGSNGLLLDKEKAEEVVRLGVDRIVISLDGVTPEAYGDVRGARISQVLDNIHGLNEAKRELGSLTPALGIEFVALKRNIDELAQLSGLASRLGASRVLVSNVLAYTDEMRHEILYGYAPRPPFNAGSWPVKADAWVMWGILDLPRMHWGAEQRCRFVKDRAAVVTADGSVAPCYALSHNYTYLTIDGRRKRVSRYSLGDINRQSLLEIWRSEDYCRFRREVQDFHFPSCPDCDLRDSCDFREKNEACWGWNPSCADCLWAQDIIRCP